jgi:hypothetical protein
MRLPSIRIMCLTVLFTSLIFALPVVAEEAAGFHFTGTISFAGEVDTYELDLNAGETVTVDLICDEISPGNRPLDPHVTVNGPDGFSVSNDDGGSQACNAFWSSHLEFTVPASGTYTFEAAAFGQTGPYSLFIQFGAHGSNAFFDPGDDRINRQAYAYASVYCDDANHRVAIYGINSDGTSVPGGKDGTGFPGIFVYYFNLPPTPSAEDGNTLIEEYGNIRFYRLTSGEYQVMVGPDSEGKHYVVVWDGCPQTYVQAYIFQNGVMTPTERFPR